MKSLLMVLTVCAACGGGNGSSADDTTGDDTTGDDAGSHPNDGGADAPGQDPSDPVEVIPAYQGIYTFGKLTTDDFSGASGVYFTESTTEHKVSNIEASFARYRDSMVLNSKFAAQFLVYDQATTTVGTAIDMPSDAVSTAIIRGGIIYIGGASKLYSYEIATGMFRQQAITGVGGCHHLAVGATRLFAVCADLTTPSNDVIVSTFANKSMSDVVTVGTVTPGKGAASSWITMAPNSDTAYFGSRTVANDCVGKATRSSVEPCSFQLGPLYTNPSGTPPLITGGTMGEDGSLLYLKTYANSETTLSEVVMSSMLARGIRSIDCYATCPDNSVVFQDSTISQKRQGGVNTDVRLGQGHLEMGCPLKKTP